MVRYEAGRPQLVVGSRRRERDGRTWTLPKGTPKRDESTEQTALREVTEETGLDVRIIRPLESIEYWARPTASADGSLTIAPPSASAAAGPSTNNSPMCDRSNRPTRSRTARCSLTIEVYWTGISQPAKSIIRAPSEA